MYSIFVDNHKNLSDEDIVRYIQSGNNEFLQSLFSRYVNLVHGKVSGYSVSNTELDDFVQEGLIALYHAAKTYDFKTSTFAGYAKICISNAFLTLLKYKNRKRRIPENLLSSIDEEIIASGYTPEVLMIERENVEGIYLDIKNILSDFEFKVFLASLNGYSVSSIAERFGVTEKSISNALCRLRKKIRTQLTDNR